MGPYLHDLTVSYLVLAPGSWAAHLDGEPGWGELQGLLAADPRKLLGPLLLAELEPLRMEDVSDLSSDELLFANIPVKMQLDVEMRPPANNVWHLNSQGSSSPSGELIYSFSITSF